jgi:enamine deaminase RidA (YjgF/YER057c/UK114 family)
MAPETGRRRFLENGALFVAGAASSSLAPNSLHAFASDKSRESIGAEQRVRELKLTLPPVPKPAATYVPYVRSGNMLYMAGSGPMQENGKYVLGKVGQDLTVEQGKAAARLTALSMLGAVRTALGSLDHVVQVVKVLGMVNATPDFTQHSQVINGFSDLLVEVFGKRAGTAARCAVGMGSLPINLSVEIDAIFQVRD